MTDIGVIRGLIELQDDFTSELGLAQAFLSNFTKENQASLKAVAGAAGLVTAAFSATAAAAIALGNRGADVNDLTETLEHFSGGADAAAANMKALRDGTKGTVDNFLLAKDAAKLLSAGVKLTTDDFGTLGQAAFVLQNRGLGGTKEMLDLVSDAMVTGRTRALAMSLGVVDVGDAEAEYAKKLGVTKDQLSDTGKAEAHRLEIMRLLNTAVKDAGVQERDFGEQLEFAKATVMNWVDELASAVAKSDVLKTGLNALFEAIGETFGDDSTEAIKTVVHWIEQAAIVGVDFGIGMVELARVVNATWSTIKAVVLGTEAVIVGLVDAVAEAVSAIAIIGEKLHIVPEGAAKEVEDVRDQLRAMTADLAEQANEAQKGIVGHSEFDKTLDKLGGTLFVVRDKMEAASKATEDNSKVSDVAANNAKKLGDMQKQVAQSMIDRAEVEKKLAAIEKKSVEETTHVWNEYYALRVEHGTSTVDAQQAQIKRWFDDEVAKLDSSDRNWQKHYDALKTLSNEKLKDVTVDWDTLHKKSKDYLQEQADIAANTYNEMIAHAEHFTREALQEQLDKLRETALAARGLGKDFEEAEKKAAEAAARASAALKEQEKAAKDAQEATRQMGGSSQVDRSNLIQNAKYWNIPENVAMEAAKRGFSFEEIIKAWQSGTIAQWVPHGPRIPGFREGGMVDIKVGEQGEEVVRVPLGSQVFANGRTPPGTSAGGGVQMTFHVNGSAKDVAREIKTVIMRELKMGRQFGSS